MQLLRFVFFMVALAAASAPQAAGVVITVNGASRWWLALAVWSSLQPRPLPEVSPYHIGVAPAPAPARDSCTFVAGVRHCPRAEPR
jgi:hypothetical protein